MQRSSVSAPAANSATRARRMATASLGEGSRARRARRSRPRGRTTRRRASLRSARRCRAVRPRRSSGSKRSLDVFGVLAEPERGSLAGRDELAAVVHPQGRRMAGVGPAQELLVREIGHARGGDELAAGTGPLDQRGVRPAQQLAGIVGERRGRGERRPDERRTPPGLQAVPDDVADRPAGWSPAALRRPGRSRR